MFDCWHISIDFGIPCEAPKSKSTVALGVLEDRTIKLMGDSA